jgi:hypothetical protein
MTSLCTNFDATLECSKDTRFSALSLSVRILANLAIRTPFSTANGEIRSFDGAHKPDVEIRSLGQWR